MIKRAFSLVLLLLFVPSLGLAAETDFVGSVKTLDGSPVIKRDDRKYSAAIGDHIYVDDVLMTESGDSLGVTFRDDTRLAIGPGSEITVDEFMFDPAVDNLSFVASVAKGSCLFTTGQMAKIAPERMVIETPQTTIGIRGTRFVVKVE